MAIDKEKLITLLIDKTDLEREQIEEQLSELVQRIQNAAEEGRTFEIEGFGTFSMEDDDLQFTPSDQLETEINNKYAGMKPIELIGAFKEPDIEELSEPDEDTNLGNDVWAFDEDAIHTEENESDEDDEESADELSEVFALEESGTETGDEDVNTTDPAKPQRIVESQEPEKDEGDPIGKVLMVAVVVIIFGAGGWLIYDMELLGSSSSTGNSSYANQTVEETQVPAQQTRDTQENQPAEDESETSEAPDNETSEPEQNLQVIKQGDTQSQSDGQSEPQDQNPYGLKGEFNDSINGYMIVLHSLKGKENAEENMQGLQEEGYRSTINEAVVDGTTYFRVGIGQFPTIEVTQQAINQLPEPYKSNNFIRRIR